MYEVFDRPFLAADTWHTNHDDDRNRFFVTLHQVVLDPAFNPDRLGDYIRQKKRIDDGHLLSSTVQDLVSMAWAVRDYFKANGII